MGKTGRPVPGLPEHTNARSKRQRPVRRTPQPGNSLYWGRPPHHHVLRDPVMRFILFFSVWFTVLGAACWYVGRRIIRPAGLRGVPRAAAWSVVAVVLLLPAVPFLFFLGGAEGVLLDRFSAAGYAVMGFFSLVFFAIAGRDILVLAGRGIRRLMPRPSAERSPEVDRERRRFIIHASNLGILGLAAGATGYGFREAHGRAEIEEVEMPVSGLPEEFVGFRIAQFSDLHVGPTIKRGFVERVVEQVLGVRADLIAFTGDLVDGSVSWLRDDVAPLSALQAPYGVYFVTGNHEYYSGAGAWVREADRLGFDVLMNEHRVLRKGGGGLVLAGVTDYGAGEFLAAHRSDAAAAARGAPSGLPKILLAHQPRSVHAAEETGFDVQLSGHTHGGQFFPWNHLATLSQPYIKGLHRHGRVWVYVNRGTAYWGPPLRLLNPPEITVVTLRRA